MKVIRERDQIKFYGTILKSFNPFVPPAIEAADDRKQFQCSNKLNLYLAVIDHGHPTRNNRETAYNAVVGNGIIFHEFSSCYLPSENMRKWYLGFYQGHQTASFGKYLFGGG